MSCTQRAGVAATLHHSPRTGKTLAALAALLGWRLPPRWALLPHQSAALEFLKECGVTDAPAPPSLGLMVFSSLVVVEQFLRNWLAGVREVQVVVVCSAEEGEAAGTATGDSAPVVTQIRLVTDLVVRFRAQRAVPLVVLTSYQSAHKVNAALVEADVALDLAVFDEAHNVHTPTRHFLYGAPSPTGLQSDSRSVPCEHTAAGLEELGRRYPRRLYLTGTPREPMRRHPAVYGDVETNWHRYSYAQLLREQDAARPVVKPFDVCIVLNGRPAGVEETPEFFDCLAMLREIASETRRIRRVKVYHRRARRSVGSAVGYSQSDPDEEDSGADDNSEAEVTEETRSAEFFGGSNELWARALCYLHDRGEALGLRTEALCITFVHGSLPHAEIRARLAAFNASEDDGRVHILCSCQIFKEGVTLENCDLAVYADGKRSRRDIVQSGMRGLKADPLRPEARLRILLLVNLDGLVVGRDTSVAGISHCVKTALQERGKMETIAAVLEALKEENDGLAEEIMRQATADHPDAAADGPPQPKRRWFQGAGDADTAPSRSEQRNLLSVRISEELLFQWQMNSEAMDAVGKGVAASVAIHMANRQEGVRKAVTRWRVRALCEGTAGSAQVPTQGGKVPVPEALQREAPLRQGLTAAKARAIDGGEFLSNIYHNWPVEGATATEKPNTALCPEDMRRIESMPWFGAWRAGDTAVTRWKVRALCEGTAGSAQVPVRGGKVPVPEALQREAPLRKGLTAAKARAIDGGSFLTAIYHNWPAEGATAAKKPGTALCPEDMRRIESMPWFGAWRQRCAPHTLGRPKRKATETTMPGRADFLQEKRRRVEAALESMQLEDSSINIDARGCPDAASTVALAAKGYDAAAFTQLHQDWKDANLGELLALSNPASDTALFLDHWVAGSEDKRLRTTDALRGAGFAAARCYCANPDAAIVAQLRKRHVRAVRSTFAEALRTTWRGYSFEVVYADFCYASAEHVKADLEALFDDDGTRRRPRVLVWTLTGRAEGSLHERLATVHEFLDRRGYKPALESMAASWRTFRPSSVVTGFYALADAAPVTTAGNRPRGSPDP